MLQTFRNALSSKFGAILALGFLALIALAFASADVSSSGGFGGVAGGDRVARVGKERIDTSALSQAASSAVENRRQQDPRISMKSFLAAGGLDQVLDELIDRTAIGEFGRKYGIIASTRLVDSEIAKIGAFKGPDGKFSEDAFRQAIAQRGLSEKLVRDDLAQGLVARQLMVPAAFGAVVPDELVLRYAALLRETRTGSIALLPSLAFAPATQPADAEIAAYYAKAKNDFIRPERRTIRYAVFGEDAVKSVAEPTDAEIAAYFAGHKADYAPLETRRITQVIVPTQADATAMAAQAGRSGGLATAARGRGLATAELRGLTRETLTAQASAAVADAVFAAAQGTIATPARSGLGWHVVHVDGIDRRPGRTVDQVRGEIIAALKVEKHRAAINDLSARLEEEFDNGGTLSDAAKELGLTLNSVGPVMADGRLYANPGQSISPDLARILGTAFAMEGQNEPQLAEVVPGKLFMIFDVADIQSAAPAPLAEIRKDVITAMMLEKGSAAARAAADKVVATVRKGTSLEAAVAGLGRPLPPVDTRTMSREQLAAMQDGIPAPVGLLFSMAQGTVKLLPANGSRGWYVVSLRQIVPGKVQPADPLLAEAHGELGRMVGQEYAEALRRAMRAEVGVEKNPAGIRAVRTQLSGGN